MEKLSLIDHKTTPAPLYVKEIIENPLIYLSFK